MARTPDGPEQRAAAHTWLFDRTTHQFTKHPRLGDAPRVTSVHIDTVTQRLLWIQGDGTTWWSDVLRCAHPETTIAVPGENVYKARWMPRRDAADVGGVGRDRVRR